MWLLRLIVKDILWLSSRLHPAWRIVLLIFGIALIVAAWYVGLEWWLAPVNVGAWYAPRKGTRLESWVLMLAMMLAIYVVLRIRS